VKPWIEKADLAIADFEGTISPNRKLGGYPLFNAPPEVVSAIKNAGYDVVDLAHNHILDSGLEGLISTDKIFKENGIDTVGVFAEKPRSQSQILVKNINGIKVAILAYSYGFNGMEAGLSQADCDNYLSDLNEEKMREEIMRAEEIADATIVMPQMGNEYQLQPTAGQIELYRKMVDWGADVVLGGHPHVAEPAEIIQKNGDKKLIIYSMGNFLSNQRIETLADITANAKWTERGVLVDFTLEKDGDKTIIKTAEARPTWVNRTPKGARSPGGIALYKYQTIILEDFIEGGKHRSLLDTQTQVRIDSAYSEMNDFMKLKFSAE
jgi:poly-gamma-glutamate synthesis protein (capsule biosynthesis protein)